MNNHHHHQTERCSAHGHHVEGQALVTSRPPSPLENPWISPGGPTGGDNPQLVDRCFAADPDIPETPMVVVMAGD